VYVYGAVDGGPVRLTATIGLVTYYWREPDSELAARHSAPGTKLVRAMDDQSRCVALPGHTLLAGDILPGVDALSLAGVKTIRPDVRGR
jgi:hypothetical protein